MNTNKSVAYINRDIFALHLLKLSSLHKIKAKIEFHAPVSVVDPSVECPHWQNWVRGAI